MQFIPQRPDYRPIGDNNTVLTADNTATEGVTWRLPLANNLIPIHAPSSFVVTPSIVWTSSGVLNPVFAMTYNTSPSGAYIDSESDGAETVASDYSSHIWGSGTTFVKTSPNTSYGFTLTSATPSNSGQLTTSIFWQQMRFYGNYLPSGTYDHNFLKKLPASGFGTDNVLTLTASAASGEYIWYAFRNAAGSPNFIHQGFTGGFQLISNSISFQNPAGFTEAYQLWRSDYPSLGTVTIEVT